MTDVDLMLRFLLQLLVILSACKVVGWIGQKFLGQTQVVMEMVTGVMLGPSLFGLLAPDAQRYLFPIKTDYVVNGTAVASKHPSMFILYTVAQIGLVIYMFMIGLEFDVKLISSRAKGAIGVSVAGILVPFILGVVLAMATAGRTDLFAPGISINESALYMGAAMCITAFPMLARILYERGIAGTTMGTLALGAGATDDAAAWSVLAIVLASSKHNINYAIFAIGGGILFGILVMTLGKAYFSRLGEWVVRDGGLSQASFVTTMLFLFAGAYVTDALGIYAVFGAFIVGAAMPRGPFVHEIRAKLESVTVGVFLPFFFIYSGLNTKLDLLNTPALWIIAGLACLAAIVGKGVACALAARMAGEPWREAWTIGTLMNARGLMELIILNIGLQQKVITPTLYTIMVLMAIVTTLMASPLFEWIYGKKSSRIQTDLLAA